MSTKQIKYSPSLFENQNDEVCYVCGSGIYVTRHECFYGRAYRNKSKKYGCWVNLCMACHDKVHFGKDHSFDVKLKQDAQRLFEKKYSHELFINEFDKNWL